MERNTLFFFGGKRRSPSAKPSRRSQGEEGGGRGARLRHRFADPRPPSAVVRHERDPRPWSCRPSFGTDLRELREHLRRCLLWVLEGRGRLVVGPHGPAAPHEGVKDSRSGLHILSLSLSLSLARAPLPLVFSLCRPCVNAQRFLDAFQNLTPTAFADPLGNWNSNRDQDSFRGRKPFLGAAGAARDGARGRTCGG